MCTAAVPRDITVLQTVLYRNAVFLHIVRVAVYVRLWNFVAGCGVFFLVPCCNRYFSDTVAWKTALMYCTVSEHIYTMFTMYEMYAQPLYCIYCI